MDSFIVAPVINQLVTFLILSLASVLCGMSKMGFPGINVLVTPLIFYFTRDVRVMVTLTLLILYPSDLLGTYVFRKDINKKAYWRFIPWAIVGVLVAAVAGKLLPSKISLTILIVIIFSFAVIMIIREMQSMRNNRNPKGEEPADADAPVKVSDSKPFLLDKILGFLSGVSSMLANTSGPLTSTYLLSTKLSKRQFIGTGALLYLTYNTVKLFITIFFWKTLTLNMFFYGLALLPFSIAGAFLSKWLSSKISEQFFRWLIISLIVITGLMLLRL